VEKVLGWYGADATVGKHYMQLVVVELLKKSLQPEMVQQYHLLHC
jgi:hypothetical protein